MLKKQPFLETSVLKKNKVFGQDQKFQSHDVLKNPQSQDRVKNHGGTRHAEENRARILRQNWLAEQVIPGMFQQNFDFSIQVSEFVKGQLAGQGQLAGYCLRELLDTGQPFQFIEKNGLVQQLQV